MRPIADSGFILPTILTLLAISSLIVIAALGEAATSAAFASRLRLRHQVFDAAETGLNVTWNELAAGADPASVSELREPGEPNLSIRTFLDAVERLPTGYSANLVLAQRYRIQSVAEGVGGARASLEMGVTRLVAGR
jgi:hypothetical protein